MYCCSGFLRRTTRAIGMAMQISAALVIGPGGCSQPVAPARPASLVTEVAPTSAAQTHLKAVCELIARRLELMPGVSQAKWNRKLPITDEQREQALLTRLTAEGVARQLPAELVTDFFQAQITAAKHVQQQAFQEWTTQQHPPFANPPDLERDVRPKIDEINRQLLAALARCWTERSAADWNAAVDHASRAAFQSTSWGDDVITAALQPLYDMPAQSMP